jgi:hypothetical protein
MMGSVTFDRQSLRAADPEIAGLISEEITRQNDGIELIASENFVSPAVLEALASPLTNESNRTMSSHRVHHRLLWRVRRSTFSTGTRHGRVNRGLCAGR